ncbi:L-glutamine-binding protein /L-glutamate-binding protein /L-aspartate-binding protein /L-asparagine-binding protein [Humitalea rosea]|uniref:L-glutamine-binding protein /L-glutamate-binding protein /L-aspartate-binding protein /L-asparagine-binding protein n=1 Tax=Humitalea rosea TaxID=990373 RepID=A0A2W7IET8_9PROT|nr:amino acid ABC transporter substrate-binding protein [Humitalea rosea]PZW45003.1 L-glutamine-binding protein /L-glutamate-binding protein /L-aspartate-binding protein /L-asparagine-binding protein [Humitalea rosea]
MPLRHLSKAVGAAVLLGGLALSAPVQAQTPTSMLDTIRSRGNLICGVNTGLAGFAQPDSQGVWRGFDVDYCRAIAAAILGDGTKVRYVPLTAQSRFTALQSGEVDVLVRNTTWTLSRDTSLGFDFAGITFYDGQGFMVKASLGLTSARELNGATICVQPGTTTEQNLTDWARSNRIEFRPVVIERIEEVVGAYTSNRCDAYTTDVSGLAATRAVQPRPADHVILPDVISKEPLGPLVRHGDQRFADIVRWTHFALLGAEEFGLTAANVDQAAASDPRPEVQRMLGKNGELGQMLGLQPNWVVSVLKTTGNYGEVFARNLTPIGIQRGPNALWTTPGGLQYSPPFR